MAEMRISTLDNIWILKNFIDSVRTFMVMSNAPGLWNVCLPLQIDSEMVPAWLVLFTAAVIVIDSNSSFITVADSLIVWLGRIIVGAKTV